MLQDDFKIGDKVMFVNHADKYCGRVGEIVGLKLTNSQRFCIVAVSGEYVTISANNEYLENVSIQFEPVADAPEDTKLPVRASGGSAGYDFYAPERIVIPARGATGLIFFNVKAKCPNWMYLQLFIRSSLAVKHSIVLETSGVIDADYYGNPDNDGNIGVKFRNHSDVDFVIEKGERCFQGIFFTYFITNNGSVLGARLGGYGSSGQF